MVEPVFTEDCGKAVAYIASLPEGTMILKHDNNGYKYAICWERIKCQKIKWHEKTLLIMVILDFLFFKKSFHKRAWVLG